MVRLEVATRAHAELVAAGMRPADVLEVARADGASPLEILLFGLANSAFVRTVFIDDEIAGLFGVIADDDWVYPWLLTTGVVDKKPKAFYRAARQVLVELRAFGLPLMLYIDCEYDAAIRFAARLGFDIHAKVPIGHQGHFFHPATLRG